MIQLLKVTTPELREAMLRAAEADNHDCRMDNYVVVKEGQIIGSVGLPVLPTVSIWLDSSKVQARDSLELSNMVRGAMGAFGHNLYCVPCEKKSPLYPYLEKVGYVKGNECTMFLSQAYQPNRKET